jgi:hypothetical protein
MRKVLYIGEVISPQGTPDRELVSRFGIPLGGPRKAVLGEWGERG